MKQGEAASGDRRQPISVSQSSMRYAPVLSILMATMVSARQTPPTPAPAAAPAQKASDESEIRLHNDFGWIGRYRDANAKVTEPVTIIFMGDSITQGWFDKMPGFFTFGRFGRGIGGQTTTRMLLRFRQAADAPAVGAAILPFLERLVSSDATLIQAGR